MKLCYVARMQMWFVQKSKPCSDGYKMYVLLILMNYHSYHHIQINTLKLTGNILQVDIDIHILIHRYSLRKYI